MTTLENNNKGGEKIVCPKCNQVAYERGRKDERENKPDPFDNDTHNDPLSTGFPSKGL